MTDDTAEMVAKTLEEIGPSVAVALEFPMAAYIDVLRGLLDNFMAAKKLQCIYITSTVPATTIQSTLEAMEIDLSGVAFVDTITQMMMGQAERGTDSIIYVESPTLLENVVLKVDYLSRRLKPGPKLVVVDSINSLAILNDPKMLSEFLHVLNASLSSREAYPVVLSIKEQDQTDSEVRKMLNLVCDQVVDLS
jgi:KaiC/GvpD/RAD55 family RecA-like ATPase